MIDKALCITIFMKLTSILRLPVGHHFCSPVEDHLRQTWLYSHLPKKHT